MSKKDQHDDQFDFMVLGVVLGASLACFIGVGVTAVHAILIADGYTNKQIAIVAFVIAYLLVLWLLFLLEKGKEIKANEKSKWLLFAIFLGEMHKTWFFFWNLIFLSLITWTCVFLLFAMILDGLF